MTTPAPPPLTSAPPCYPEDSDISWVLISSVLVLGMMPGLAFFEAGLLRAKNTTSIVIQIFSGAAFLPVLWVLFGYSLTLGTNPDNGFIGDFSKGMWVNVAYDDCFGNTVIPEALYALFQMMFATITPLLLTGAYAERLAFRPFIIFTVLWEVFVYYPVAHWMWSTSGWLNKMGAEDFAGGIVIHTTAGVSALVAVAMLGRRRDFHKHHGEAPYSSLPLTSIGATMLWTGWFGFNGGSALMAGQGAVHAVVNSQVAAAVCSTCFLFFVMFRTGKASLLHCINGAIAGLAGVTPASGYISTQAAFVLGIILFISAQGSIWVLKHKLKIDDALDVSSVHGVPGLVGALYIGFCGSSQINGSDGILYGGGGRLLGVQLLACIVASAWSALFTFVILKLISRKYPLRVDEIAESLGLDRHQHEEPSTQHDHHHLHEGHGLHVGGHHPSVIQVPNHSMPNASKPSINNKSYGANDAPVVLHSTRASQSSHRGGTRGSQVHRVGHHPTGLNPSFAVRVNDETIVRVESRYNQDTVDLDADPREFDSDEDDGLPVVQGQDTDENAVPLIRH